MWDQQLVIWQYIWQCVYYVGPTFGTFGNVCIMCDQQAIMYWKPKEQFVDINPHITLIMGNQLQV